MAWSQKARAAAAMIRKARKFGKTMPLKKFQSAEFEFTKQNRDTFARLIKAGRSGKFGLLSGEMTSAIKAAKQGARSTVLRNKLRRRP